MECQSAKQREGPLHENGASEELQMVMEWSGEGSAESSGHQTERVGSHPLTPKPQCAW